MDTIAAIATPHGQAALGIIRISGPAAGRILSRVVPKTKAIGNPNQMCFGVAKSLETNEIIDQVMCFFSKGPTTSTGENIAEIHGHGGILVMKSLLDQVTQAGARLATPGEFSSRAFSNGRMDLTQAEAVMALIGARSQRAATVAARQLSGAIGDWLGKEYVFLTHIAAQLEAGLDFPDEDLPVEQTSTMATKLASAIDKLTKAQNSFSLGHRLTEGARIVIAGPSNAGKSSLLNTLIDEDRALVDALPGTTRDIVEARSEIEGIPITFYDTAGLRENAGNVEQKGIVKSRNAARDADILLFVVDGQLDAKPIPNPKEELARTSNVPILLIYNKCDLPDFHLPKSNDFETLFLSAKTKEGIPQLRHRINEILHSDLQQSDYLLTTTRQLNAVVDTIENLNRALNILRKNREPELAAADLRCAREALGSLWGKDTTEEVIDEIFSSFCLGK